MCPKHTEDTQAMVESTGCYFLFIRVLKEGHFSTHQLFQTISNNKIPLWEGEGALTRQSKEAFNG